MAWTASISGKAQNVGYIEFAVKYVDGVRSRDELIRIDDGNLDGLKVRIAARIAQLTAVDVLDPKVTVGGAFDTTITPPAPDAAEVAFQSWMRDYGRLRKVQELIGLGVLTGSETAVTNLRDSVKTNFLPAYVNRF